MSDSGSRAAFGPIVGATVMAADIDSVVASYTKYLGHTISGEGTISEDLAAVWNTPAHIGTRFITIIPESGNAQWIRFIEAEPVPGYKPMTTFGWHSLEIVVDDVDAIPARLEGSPWKTIGEPHYLGMSSNIKAMQVEGLAPEVLYLTQTNAGPDKPYLPNAESFVDRIFIVVLGSPSLDEARAWYAEHFDTEPGDTMEGQIGVLTRAMGLDAETIHSLCVVKMRGKCLIEIDDYPSVATKRDTLPDSLPPGIASVSFGVDSLDDVKLPFISAAKAIAEAPYNGARVAVTLGVAGERIEMVEVST